MANSSRQPDPIFFWLFIATDALHSFAANAVFGKKEINTVTSKPYDVFRIFIAYLQG
jgi:hypothetical protein